MGEIWDAVHRPSGRPVAVKVIASEHAHHTGFAASLRHEAAAMARFCHPNIVRALDLGDVDEGAAVASDHRLVAGSPWLAMERVQGGTLADHILALRWGDVQLILLKLLSALAHAHARDILHRDLKPANVLLAEGGTTWDLRLTDFGIAQPLHTEELVGPRMAGTPMFMAPEQSAGDWRSYRPATDLFSVGRIATALLAREDGVARVPVGFEAWLRRMQADLPQDRFPMAADAAAELRRLGPATAAFRDDTLHPLDEPTVLHQQPVPQASHPSRPSTTLGRFAPTPPADWLDQIQERAAPLANTGAGLLGVRTVELIGRTEERNALWAQLHRVHRTRRTHLAVLRGAEGIGKHALASWLSRRAHETGSAWPHHVAFDPIESGVDALGRLVARENKTLGLSHLEAAPRIRELAALYGIDDPYDVEALAEIANPKPDDEPGFRFGSRAERLQILGRFLHWAASTRPSIVVLQDAQWSQSAFELVETVLALDRLEPVPLLVVITVQDQALKTCFRERAALDALVDQEGSRTLDLTVGPLSPTDQMELVANLVGFDPQAVRPLAREGEGNPLVVIQQVLGLHEAGRLQPGPRGFVPDTADHTTQSVSAVWEHRLAAVLDHRSANSRISVELLAVLGRRVTHGDWLGLCRRAGVDPSRHLVDALLTAGLLQVEDETYQFSHHSLREVVLQRAEAAGRLAGHHAACADLLLRHGRGADREGRIGDHLLRAGQRERALPHLRRGAEAAFDERRIQRARELIDRWQEAFGSLALPPEDPRNGDAFELQGRLAITASEPLPAEQAATQLRRLALKHGWRRHQAVALFLLGWAAYGAGRPEDAIAHFTDALERVPEQAHDLRADILFNLARTTAHWGDVEASIRYTALARAAYLEQDDLDGERLCLLLAANGALQQNRPEEALALARTARQLGEEVGSLAKQAEALTMAGEIHRSQGRVDEALEAYRLSRRMLRVTRGASSTAIVDLNIVQALATRGEHAEARELGVRAIEAFQRAGRDGLAGAGHCLLLPSLATLGHRSAYEHHLKVGQEILERLHFRLSDALYALERAAPIALKAGWVDLAAETTALSMRMASW